MIAWYKRLGVVVFAINLYACSLFTPQNAKSALQVSEIACVLYQETASKPLPAIMTLCQIDQSLTPAVEALLAARKQEAAMLRASAADGGADSGK